MLHSDSDPRRPEPPIYVLDGNAVQPPARRRAHDAPAGTLAIMLIVSGAVATGLVLTCLVCAVIGAWS